MPDDVAVVSAADETYFDLLQGMIRSLRDKPQGRALTIYAFDLGLSAAQQRWLRVQGVKLRPPERLPFRQDLPLYLHAFLSRCRLPELFPGHQVYLWIDADAWVQRWDAVEAYVEGARRSGFAVAPESDPAYDRDMLEAAHQRSFSAFGVRLEQLRSGPINAGVFAGRAGMPHWQEWRQVIEANFVSIRDHYLLFLLDQTALCLLCTRGDLPVAMLPTDCNWLCHFAMPAISEDGGRLLRPTPPHEPLGIVHQAGDTKRGFFPLRRPGGGFLSRTVSYQAPSLLPAGDYVSPGLTVIMPDACFPDMIAGDYAACDWRYLRREVPHRWLVDRRVPQWGFLNRDEVHILYNLALQFCGRRALEIGCLFGWSTCHLGLAGLDLDVVDPLLANPEVAGSVHGALQAARVPGPVRLVPRRSPEAVHELAAERAPWSLFLIDGDQQGDAPLADAEVCESYAAPDSAMVFHDLAAPDVARAVLYLKERGWQVRVYHTAQIMAVAWRGAVHPVVHRPDPRVDWPIPDHLLPLLG